MNLYSLRSAEFKLVFCPCVTVLFKRVKTVARGWFQELKSQSHRCMVVSFVKITECVELEG